MTDATFTTAAVLTATAASRQITGLVVPWGAYGRTSAGRLRVARDAVRLPADLARVKLLRGHDRDAAVGYAVAARSTAAGLEMTFTIAPTPAGDEALAEAVHGVRDAFSVELDDLDASGDEIRDSALTAVALLSVPAFDDARVADVAASDHPSEGEPMPTDQTTTEAPADDDAASAPPAETEAPPAETTTPPEAPPVQAARRPAAVTAGRASRSMTFDAACAHLSAALANRGPAALVAALADVVPADDAGMGWLRPQWLDEIWTPQAESRDFINAVSRQTLTTGLKVYGWRFVQPPQVGPYEGNKTEIPTNEVTTEPVEAPIERYAGGWDLDRIYVDLGSPGFIESFFRAAVIDLRDKQEASIAATLVESATVPADVAADVWSAIDVASRALQVAGASLSFVGVSADLWSEFLATPRAEVPWWVPNGASPSLRDSTGAASDVRFFANHTLPAGTVLAGDRRAVTWYEASPSPVRVQAVNIPNGGIDLAVFAYNATLVNDARGLVKITVPTGGGEG